MSNNKMDGFEGALEVTRAVTELTALLSYDDARQYSLLERIAVALERIADIYTEQHALPVELFDAVQRGEHDDN